MPMVHPQNILSDLEGQTTRLPEEAEGEVEDLSGFNAALCPEQVQLFEQTAEMVVHPCLPEVAEVAQMVVLKLMLTQ